MVEYFEGSAGTVDALVQVLVQAEHALLLLWRVVRRVKARAENKYKENSLPLNPMRQGGFAIGN